MDNTNLVYAPKYIQVRESLRKRIRTGELRIGAKIPPERQLLEEYSVSRITVLNAIKDLVNENYLERRGPAGTFVLNFKRQKGIIGALISNAVIRRFSSVDELFAIRHACSSCKKHGCALQILTEDDFPTNNSTLGELTLKLDGVIVLGMNPENLIIRINAAMPTVLFDYRLKSGNVYSLMPENVEGSRKITEFLARKGRKRIAHIHGPLDDPAFQERFRGYRLALDQCGLDNSDDLVAEGGDKREHGQAAAAAIFAANKENPPDALFAANDIMAFGAMKYFIENGIRIPVDVAVAGFDDIPAASCVVPALTTVRVNRQRMMKRCVELLFRQIKGEPSAICLNENMPCEIIIRETT